jgi:hypothetical protein
MEQGVASNTGMNSCAWADWRMGAPKIVSAKMNNKVREVYLNMVNPLVIDVIW